MNRSHWRVLPGLVLLALFLAAYVLNELILPSEEWKQDLGGGAILVFASMTYGVYRGLALHPYYRWDYLRWLRHTPWRPTQPLPLGPVHLVWIDFVVLAVLSLLGLRHPVIAGCVPLLAFLLPYVLVLSPTFALTGVPAFAYGVAGGLGLLFRIVAGRNPLTLDAWHRPLSTIPNTVVSTWLLVVGIGLYAVVWFGLKRSFSRLHEWPEPFFGRSRNAPKQLGWPFDALGPQRSELRINMPHAIGLSILAGWWLFCFAGLPNMKNEEFALFCGMGVVAAALVRVCVYCIGYAAPISIKGRLATARWIIPKYDQVFVAPLTTILIGAVGIWWSDAVGIAHEIGYSLVGALGLFTTLTMRPTHEEWRLTGGHRLVSVNSRYAQR